MDERDCLIHVKDAYDQKCLIEVLGNHGIVATASSDEGISVVVPGEPRLPTKLLTDAMVMLEQFKHNRNMHPATNTYKQYNILGREIRQYLKSVKAIA